MGIIITCFPQNHWLLRREGHSSGVWCEQGLEQPSPCAGAAMALQKPPRMDIKGIGEPLAPDGSDHLPNEAHLRDKHLSLIIALQCCSFVICTARIAGCALGEGAGSPSHVLWDRYTREIDSIGICLWVFSLSLPKALGIPFNTARVTLEKHGGVCLHLYPSESQLAQALNWGVNENIPCHSIAVGSHGH